MAQESVDLRLSEVISRIEAVETALNESKDDTEDDSHVDVRRKDNKHRLRADLADLKARIAALDDPDDSDNASETSSVSDYAPAEIIPQLNRVHWTQFKNSTMGDSQYTIDVLIGPVKSYWQIRQEELGLPQGGLKGDELAQGGPPPALDIPTDSPDLDAPSTNKERTETQNEVPERIRINCTKLTATLGNVAGASVGSGTVVLLRPYKLLVRHEEALRQRLLELEAQHDSLARENPQEEGSIEDEQLRNQRDPDINSEATHNHDLRSSTDIKEKKTEVYGLRCLLEFMDIYLLPVYRRYRSYKPKKIRFCDLWYLFRPGDTVATRLRMNEKTNTQPHSTSSHGVAPTLCRILSVSQGRPELNTLHGAVGAVRRPAVKIHDFHIKAHTIAYDGSSFGPVPHYLTIAPFEGEKEINTLNPCPLRYLEDSADVEARLVDRGKLFMHYTKPTHCRYVGPTFSEHQIGLPCKVADKTTTIDGHVIVDFKEARREDDDWVMYHDIPSADSGLNSEVSESYSRTIWRDREHTELKLALPDEIYDDDHVDQDDLDDLVLRSVFLAAYRRSSGKVDQDNFERLDFALLPGRVVGYDLHRHVFAILALDYLQPVHANTDGWADLKLPIGHKPMVQAQIRTHFLRKQSRQNHATPNTDIDLVRGKGLGLIILLHGAPGVGKTSTAECVAESLGKPLYPITCGDLGVTAESVEKTLARTFAKAEAWDCVLLLDEADVFLAQRTRTDLVRNAIVSVFLRVLEYYKGTLILTTNRVGAFDEAFKSRIHLNLYYPALNKDQTLAIWKMNLERLVRRKEGRLTADMPEILTFADQLFERQSQTGTRWNGRQIRNAFQTALAMAEYEALGDMGLTADWELLEKIQSRLKVAHFETVAHASAEFDAYIKETIGNDDANRAYMDRERADHFRWYGPVNAHDDPRHAQWPYKTSGPYEGSFHQASHDPFATSPGLKHSAFYASQEAASVQTSFRQGQAWTSPQQPWSGMGLSPGYLPKQEDSEHRGPDSGRDPFDSGRPVAPLTPSNRGREPDLYTPVRLGAYQG